MNPKTPLLDALSKFNGPFRYNPKECHVIDSSGDYVAEAFASSSTEEITIIREECQIIGTAIADFLNQQRATEPAKRDVYSHNRFGIYQNYLLIANAESDEDARLLTDELNRLAGGVK